jgi:hypothetical protein
MTSHAHRRGAIVPGRKVTVNDLTPGDATTRDSTIWSGDRLASPPARTRATPRRRQTSTMGSLLVGLDGCGRGEPW